MRKFTKHAVYDYMHRGIVISMMGITCVGCVMLGLHTYRFFKYVRPLQQEQKRLLAEEKLVQEQNEQEAELLRRQKEAEGL